MREDRHGQSPGLLEGRITRRSAIGQIAGAGTVAALASASVARLSASASRLGVSMNQEASPSPVNGTPTIAFVHGAWADNSGWSDVMKSLTADGFEVVGISNPLRGPAFDGAYVASLANTIPGPVLLVGHSYGGAVITVAGPQVPNAVGLVYVAGFAPDEGESIQALADAGQPTLLGPALRPVPVVAGDTAAELFVDRASFHEVFCGDLSDDDAAVLAANQRPANAAGFGEPFGPVAWKSLPSWHAIATADNTIGTENLRFMAQRAGSVTVDVDGSHVIMISQPEAVADLIRTAVGSLA
jgi:pimeloyl-ACP methyl ester carboxylesterase